MRVAVVGATGAVGREMLRILEERDFPVDELFPLASARSEGKKVPFRDGQTPVQELTHERLADVELALLTAGAAVSRAFVPDAAAAGVTCIDNSSAFRMEPDVPLSIPEVNPEALEGSPALSSYQSVSGAGWKAVRELIEQIDKLHGMEEELGHPDMDAMPVGEVAGKTIAFNLLAKIADFGEGGYTGEELKIMAEPGKILGVPDLEVAATAVRVPVLVGHSVSLVARFSRPIPPHE